MLRSRKIFFLFLAWIHLVTLVPEGSAQGFSLSGFQVVSSNRVGRTQWEYVLRAIVTNNVANAVGVQGFVYSTSSNTVVLQEKWDIGNVAFGSSLVSTGTFVVRQDRLFPFDPAGLQTVFLAESMPLSVGISSPISGLLTNGTNVLISGTVGQGVNSVIVGRERATLNGNNFNAIVPLEEGRNTVSAVATNAFGGAGVDNITVIRDTTPPVLNVEAPVEGAILSSRQLTVSGLVNDAVPGTVNPEQASVMVNGLPATVLNRSYAIPEILLVPGKNIIDVMARDRAGNVRQKQIEVTYQSPASRKHLVRLAGEGQTALVASVLPEPLVVEMVDGDGVVQTNQPVTFSVTRNDGLLLAPPDTGRSLTLLTDYRGQAQLRFQLGLRTGVANNQVEVSSPGVTPVLFCANSTGAPPAKVTALIPETQTGETGKPLPNRWTAFVTDGGGNPVAGAPVTFMVFLGTGTLGGATTIITNTDSDGRASVIHTLGAEEGVNNNSVLAFVPGVTNSSAVFTASARSSQQLRDTRVVGLVLDNANRPMSNILCRLVDTFLGTATDAQGQFVISNAPVGAVRLIVDARDRGYTGEWHFLEFDLVNVAGQANSLDRPIYMVPLDTASGVLAGGNQDVVLHLKDMPGSSLTIFANSVRDPNGNPTTSRVTWTQVNAERIPMSPPLGSQPMFTSAIQPANLRFNPPARMCIPNSGAPPGQILEMFGFDHDIGAFVAVGTATVSSNGAQICSDPGFGVVKSGWHPVVPPPPPCTPVCSGPPADTECTTYQTIPPASACACPTYKAVPKTITPTKANGCKGCNNGTPIPPQTDPQCCGTETFAGGFVVCCNGVKLACAGSSFNGTSKAQTALRQCVILHEQEHYKHVDCPTGANECNTTRPPFKPGQDAGQGECDASKVEVTCLQGVNCGGDAACEAAVAARIAQMKMYGNNNKAGCFP